MTQFATAQYTARLSGGWGVLSFHRLGALLDGVTLQAGDRLTVDGSGLTHLDTGGAYGLLSFFDKITGQGIDLTLTGFPQKADQTLARIRTLYQSHLTSPAFEKNRTVPPWQPYGGVQGLLARLGDGVLGPLRTICLFLSFLGACVMALGAAALSPKRVRWRAVVNGLRDVGVAAVPIVGLISFLIGIVLVYQGADQLKRFGADIFTVDLLAVSVLREIGVLLTAIVVAGRSASAYTAGLGFMKLNQEVDALTVLGLDPDQVLIVPRLLSLVIALPLLVFWADMMALLGGALLSTIVIDLSVGDFLHHLRLAIKPWSFWIGVIKAPFFAFFIALIGCFEGMRLQGGAEDVGRHTTKSVVESIFFVIVLDAAFSIFFSVVGV